MRIVCEEVLVFKICVPLKISSFFNVVLGSQNVRKGVPLKISDFSISFQDHRMCEGGFFKNF